MRQPYGDVLRVPEFGFEPDHSVFEGFVETGFGADFDYFAVVGALDLYQDLIGNLLIAGLFGRHYSENKDIFIFHVAPADLLSVTDERFAAEHQVFSV